MKLRFWGDDCYLRGATALACIRYHMGHDHSKEARNGDVDGVMKRLATCYPAQKMGMGQSYASLPTLEERAEAFINAALECGWLIDVNAEKTTGEKINE